MMRAMAPLWGALLSVAVHLGTGAAVASPLANCQTPAAPAATSAPQLDVDWISSMTKWWEERNAVSQMSVWWQQRTELHHATAHKR